MVNLLVYHHTERQREEINFQKLQITSIKSKETNEVISLHLFHYQRGLNKKDKEKVYLKLSFKKFCCCLQLF